jgi:hypothetical protein
MATNFEDDDDDKNPREREPLRPNADLFSQIFEKSYAPRPGRMPIGASTPRGSNALGVGMPGVAGGGAMPVGVTEDLLGWCGFGPGGTRKE